MSFLSDKEKMESHGLLTASPVPTWSYRASSSLSYGDRGAKDLCVYTGWFSYHQKAWLRLLFQSPFSMQVWAGPMVQQIDLKKSLFGGGLFFSWISFPIWFILQPHKQESHRRERSSARKKRCWCEQYCIEHYLLNI